MSRLGGGMGEAVTPWKGPGESQEGELQLGQTGQRPRPGINMASIPPGLTRMILIQHRRPL